MTLQAPMIDPIILRGGLDQITPTLSLGAGFCRQSLNFEAGVTGGYSRIVGYERFDGHTSPSDAAAAGTHRFLMVASFTNTPATGDTLTSSGGASGTVAYVSGLLVVVTKSTGTWTNGHTLTVGATPIGTLANVYGSPTSQQQAAQVRNAVADIYRSSIAAVPGIGPVRGVVEFNDVVYAFRNNVSGLTLDIYKSSSSGWVNVPLYKTVSFTAGGTGVPVDGNTLAKGGVTATVKRVVLTSGSWQSGTAAGQLIITTPAGGSFSSGSANVGSVAVTLSGAETAITLLPGGRFIFEERNFAGQATSMRLYGCDGINKAFEFDGDVLVPITTGASDDTPCCLTVHKGFLFLALGSSVIHSAPGLPYDFTAISGASEIATGDAITGMISMPGTTGSATLGITSRNNTFILYGTGTADWDLVTYNTGTGAVPYTLQNMAQTFAFDDRGVNSIQTSLQYGNFTQSALTNGVLPFINERIGKATSSTLCRRKSQYRIFFNDGYGMYITLVNNKLLGCMPVYFPDVVECTYEGKKNNGADVMYFGSSSGMVYQMEKGTSFDGAAIAYYLTTNFSNARSPRTIKRYRKCVPEITSDNTSFAMFDFSYTLGYGSDEYERDVPVTYSASAGGARWDSGLTWDTLYWDPASSIASECEMDGSAENVALLVNGSSDYVDPFTISSFLVHYSSRRMMR